ncbi:MAG: SCP2 sterol-binding domain-containing protein [Pseudomonadota bacterium]
MSAAVDLIKKLPQAYSEGADCVIQFNISQPHYVTIKGGAADATAGTAPNADLGITMEDEDFVALMKGELNGMTAFMTGKLQLEGDLMLAQKLSSYFDPAKLG